MKLKKKDKKNKKNKLKKRKSLVKKKKTERKSRREELVHHKRPSDHPPLHKASFQPPRFCNDEATNVRSVGEAGKGDGRDRLQGTGVAEDKDDLGKFFEQLKERDKQMKMKKD